MCRPTRITHSSNNIVDNQYQDVLFHFTKSIDSNETSSKRVLDGGKSPVLNSRLASSSSKVAEGCCCTYINFLETPTSTTETSITDLGSPPPPPKGSNHRSVIALPSDQDFLFLPYIKDDKVESDNEEEVPSVASTVSTNTSISSLIGISDMPAFITTMKPRPSVYSCWGI